MKPKILHFAAALFLIIGITTLIAQLPPFEPPVFHEFGLDWGSDYIASFKLVDLDQDDTLEVVAALYDGQQGDLRYYENIGSNAAPAFVWVESYPFGLPRNIWQLVDLDGDGKEEVFFSQFANNIPVRMRVNIAESGPPDFSGDYIFNPYGITLPTSHVDGDTLDGNFPRFSDL